MSEHPANEPNAVIDDKSIPAINSGFRLQFEQAQDAWVLLYPEGMVKLNPTAAEIMQRVDGKRDVNEIVGLLETAFEQQGLGDDIKAFLKIAREQSWISVV